MFYKELDNGKYRYYEKFYDDRDKKWKQVTVTLKSKSRVSQAEAKRRLATKIDKILTTPTKEELKQQKYEATTFSQLLAEWKTIRASEIKPSSFRSEMKCLQFFADAVGDLKLSEYTTQQIQSYLMSLNVENSTRKNRKIYLRLC